RVIRGEVRREGGLPRAALRTCHQDLQHDASRRYAKWRADYNGRRGGRKRGALNRVALTLPSPASGRGERTSGDGIFSSAGAGAGDFGALGWHPADWRCGREAGAVHRARQSSRCAASATPSRSETPETRAAFALIQASSRRAARSSSVTTSSPSVRSSVKPSRREASELA